MSALGKIGATVLIFTGLGVFAVAIQQVAAESLAKNEKNPGWLLKRFWGDIPTDDETRND